MKDYYDRRADEYDRTAYGAAGAQEAAELAVLERVLGDLPPARTLDVACGTGFLTRWLRGAVVGLDRSEAMLRLAGDRLSTARFVRADAASMPFADRTFDRVFTGHFYGHLQEGERRRFVDEARRIGSELVVVDSALRDGLAPEVWQERTLADGSRFAVFKRHLTADRLLTELGGGEALLAGTWFTAVRSPSGARPT